MNKSLYFIVALIIAVSAIVWYKARYKPSTVESSDTITVGTNAEFPPFSFKQGDTITGFDIDVITEVIKRLDKKMVIKDMPFDVLLSELQLGGIDVIAAGITPTPERAQRVLFTKPHISGDKLAIISLATRTPIKDIHDLYGKSVVVNEGYTADTYMSHHQGPLVTRLSSAYVVDGMLALQSGSADAYVSALHPLKAYFDKVGTDQFRILPIESTEESSAFAVSKFHPELRDYMQTILDRMEDDGTLAQIKNKWGLS